MHSFQKKKKVYLHHVLQGRIEKPDSEEKKKFLSIL